MDDPLLRRLERNGVIVCLSMALVGGAIAGVPGLLSVLGGGVLAAVSYMSLASGVTALTTAMERVATPRAESAAPKGTAGGGKTLAKVVFRYALLILLAYVMIARLRLHPLGVVAGVSSVVAAAGIEAVRILVKKS